MRQYKRGPKKGMSFGEASMQKRSYIEKKEIRGGKDGMKSIQGLGIKKIGY